MRKLAILVLLVGATTVGCRRQVATSVPPTAVTTGPGAGSPREAVQRFMAAAKSQDLQAMSNIWGTSAGPARTTMGREELEQREVIIIGCLKHDRYTILGEGPAAGGERVLSTEVVFRDLTRRTNFWAVRGPSERWYVKTLDLESLRDICVRKS